MKGAPHAPSSFPMQPEPEDRHDHTRTAHRFSASQAAPKGAEQNRSAINPFSGQTRPLFSSSQRPEARTRGSLLQRRPAIITPSDRPNRTPSLTQTVQNTYPVCICRSFVQQKAFSARRGALKASHCCAIPLVVSESVIELPGRTGSRRRLHAS